MSFSNTKLLKDIPFHKAYSIYTDAANRAAYDLEQTNLDKYNNYLATLEQEWNDTHEAPYEGNFSDSVPYIPHSGIKAAKKKAGQAALVEEFIPAAKLDTIAQSWVLPQIMSWLVSKPIFIAGSGGTRATSALGPDFATVEGKIDCTKAAAAMFNIDSEWELGLYYFLMLNTRSSYLTSQYKGEGRAYCSLVPLILYAWKLHNDIKYSDWDRGTLRALVNTSLADAMLCEVPELTIEEKIAAQAQGLKIKTGAKAGTSRNPLTTYKLYDTRGTKLHGLPELAQTMLAQIWCAHPQNRTKYMVLDPQAWDTMPTPLLKTEIFSPSPKTATVPSLTKLSIMPRSHEALPWDL